MSADLKRIVQIVFQGVDDTGTVVRGIASDMDKLASGVQGATQPLADMHDYILKIQTALGALAVGGMALSIKAAGEFDAQFREITTLLDDTGEGVGQFREEIKTYAQDSSASLEDINSALYAAISAGTDYKDSVELLSTAEQLADAGRAGLSETMLALVSTLNAYGESTDEAARYSDILFTAVKEGQTTLPEMAASLSQVTSLAAAAGVPFETLAAGIATLTAKGMPTAEAMTAIRGAIQAIIKPTGDAANLANELGIQFDAAALESKGFEAVLQEVWEATGGNTEEIARLFGNVRGLTGVLAAFGQDGGEAFQGNLEKMRGAAGATAEAYEKMADNFKIVNDRLATNVRLTFVEIGDNLLDSYGDVTGSITGVFQALQDSIKDGAFDEVFDVLDALAGDLSATFDSVAENLPAALNNVDFSRFADSVEDLTRQTAGLFKDFFGDVDLDTPEGLAQAIQRIVNTITALTEISASIIESWRVWSERLGNLVDRFGELNQGTTDTIGNVLQFGKVLNVGAGFVSSFSGALDGLGALLKVIAAQRLVSLITGLGGATKSMGGLQTAISGAMGTAAGKTGMVGLAAYAGYTAGTLINEYVPAVGKAAQSLYGWVDGLTDFSGKGAAAEREAESFGSMINSIADNIDKFSYDLSGVREQLSGLGHDLSGMSDADVIRLAAEVDVLSFDDAMDIVQTKVPDEKSVNIQADAEQARQELTDFGHDVEGMSDEQVIELRAIHDEVSFEQSQAAVENIDSIIQGIDKEPEVSIHVDDDGTTHIVQDRIAEIPEQKDVEITPELEPEIIKAQLDTLAGIASGYFDTIQTAVEWEAKLEIAEVEASAQKVEAIMGSLSASVESAGGVLESIFGGATDLRDAGFSAFEVELFIREQNEIQRRGLEVQERMAEAEMSFMQARMKRMESGEPLITVSGDGLAPHLEMIMFEVLGAVQARASEEAQNFLLGV